MTGALDLVLIVAWISVIAYLARQTTRKSRSTARTGSPSRRQRARPGNGGMSERFTPPPRYVPDVEVASDTAPDRFATALATLTPALLCTLCVIELKQARAAGQPDPEVLPGIVLGEILTGGRPSVAVLCEVRHILEVGSPPPRSLAPAEAL